MKNLEHPHIISYQKLLAILLALFGLTGITIGVSQMELGVLNVWAALLVAAVKSTLVFLYFMHLRYENRLLRVGLIVTLCFMTILIGFLFLDIAFR